MSRYALAYGAAFAVLLALDYVYLSRIGQALFQSHIGDLMLDRPNLGAAAAFYLLYPAGIVIFAIKPAWANGSATSALVAGGLFGLLAYATYDLTNLATLRGWTVGLAAADIGWGIVLTGLAAGAGYFASKG